MIKLVKTVEGINEETAEAIKLGINLSLYNKEALFWVQDEQRAIISMLDGNMVIVDRGANRQELKAFINAVSPQSVFANADLLCDLFGNGFETVRVVRSDERFENQGKSDQLSSQQIYDILSVKELELPPYEYFAPDFCRRLNNGFLKYFAKQKTAAAIGIVYGGKMLINGIASHKKGEGSRVLKGLLEGQTTLAICKDSVLPFYLKNGFKHIYNAGYWRKKN